MLSYEPNIKKIVEILLYNGQYHTLEQIAKCVGRSKRSIQNYLADIDSWIAKNGLLHTKIIRKQGKGVAINADAVDKLKIEKLLSGNSLSIYGDDNKRRLEIIKKLIILEDNATIRSLTEIFFVSRSIVLSDLKWIGDWLSSYGLELAVSRSGIKTTGGEVSYRNAIAGYFDSYMEIESGGDTAGAADGNGGAAQGESAARGRFHDISLRNIITIYPEETVLKVKEIIEASENQFHFYLTDDYYASLLTHIVISVSRLINGNTVPPEFAPPDDEEFPAYIVETAQFITDRLESVFKVNVSNDEKKYICIHLVGFNALSAEQTGDAEMPAKIKRLALELIKAVDARMGARFISDELLFLGLCLHLKAKVFRLQKNVYYKKTFQFQLSDANISIYNAVINASRLYQEICGVEPDEEELLNVTCYLLLSIHRNLRKPKALLICSEGIIERMEFMDFIGKSLPSIEIADCCTAYQLKFLASADFDFIIATESLDFHNKPVVNLSGAERDEYAAIVMNFLKLGN